MNHVAAARYDVQGPAFDSRHNNPSKKSGEGGPEMMPSAIISLIASARGTDARHALKEASESQTESVLCMKPSSTRSPARLMSVLTLRPGGGPVSRFVLEASIFASKSASLPSRTGQRLTTAKLSGSSNDCPSALMSCRHPPSASTVGEGVAAVHTAVASYSAGLGLPLRRNIAVLSIDAKAAIPPEPPCASLKASPLRQAVYSSSLSQSVQLI
mmetsp:Transcript_41119/g.66835  ORF Transcript_41119/g.66835 Transcript_41119/m.66835 type:complete len:214 (+) Transcript_41119:282-923(+)